MALLSFLLLRPRRKLLILLIYGAGSPWVLGQTITTVAGNGTLGFSGDGGPALTAMLADIDGITVDPSGNIYLVQSANHRVRRVDAMTQIITTVAGNGIPGFAGDGGPATAAEFNDIDGIDRNALGDLFIADAGNSRIRKVDGATGIVRTVAGNGTAAFSGDGGPATLACLRFPGGVAVDANNDLYIADTYNNRIRRVDAVTGTITTVAGNGVYGFSGDGGPAVMGELHFPSEVAVDAQGDLFIADTWNQRIRRVDSATQLMTTIAGTGVRGFGGDGGPAVLANLDEPFSAVVDAGGGLFIADSKNHRIRKVNGSTGVITTVAGTGTAFYSGDGGAATLAALNLPSSVAQNGSGALYIADDNNNRIRKVTALLVAATPLPTPTSTAGATASPTLTQTPVPTGTANATPSSPFTPVCQPHIWPNPFNPAHAVGKVLKVGCVPPGGAVSFFTLSGELVRRTQEVNGMVHWDGRNRNGALVADGIYFYDVQRGDRVIQSGRLLVRTGPD